MRARRVETVLAYHEQTSNLPCGGAIILRGPRRLSAVPLPYSEAGSRRLLLRVSGSSVDAERRSPVGIQKRTRFS